MTFLTVTTFSVLASRPDAAAESDTAYKKDRHAMLENQIVHRGVRDPKVLAAVRNVPRHLFVPPRLRRHAYEDTALPIGHQQTISQPFIVAAMTEQLELVGTERVLEIGTGSGYQAAVLAEIVPEVYTIEIIPELAKKAETLLTELHYKNVFVRTGDGYQGWPEKAPFDAVIVTAAPRDVPIPLVEQLKLGGRLVIPVGPANEQELVTFTKTAGGLEKKNLFPVRFVPFLRSDEK